MSSLHASNTHKLRRLATLSSVCTSGLGQAPTLLQPMCSYVGHPCSSKRTTADPPARGTADKRLPARKPQASIAECLFDNTIIIQVTCVGLLSLLVQGLARCSPCSSQSAHAALASPASMAARTAALLSNSDSTGRAHSAAPSCSNCSALRSPLPPCRRVF